MADVAIGGGSIRSGLTVGLVLAVFSGIITALYDFGILPGTIQCAEFLIALAAFFIAGLLAARATGRVMSGLIAGLIASVCAAVVILGANIIMALVSPKTFGNAFGYHDVTSGQLVSAAIIQSLLGLLLWAVFGLVLGVIGGVIGRRRETSPNLTASSEQGD